MLILGFVLLNGAFLVDSQPEVGAGTPENITVQLIDSKTVEIFWTTTWKNVERYDVTYNPTEDRVVSQAAGNSHSIVLRELRPNTQYQVMVTAVVGGKNYRSRRLVFRTSHDPNETLDFHEYRPLPTKPTKPRKSHPVTQEIVNPDPTAVGSKYTPPTSTTVRGVEIGLVLLALVVWIIAIALFFHRWGKIRMLLPYQPDYKTQQSLKVPGTGTTIVTGCTGTTATQGQADGPGCVQHLRWPSRYLDESSTAKKSSPTKRAHKLQVSSTLLPTSSSFFYMRTSTECESPKIIRHAYSHSEFSTEAIPLCQVTQPRKESHKNIVSVNVPVVANSINEKAQTKKTPDRKPREQNKASETDAIINLEDGEFCDKDSKKAVRDCEKNSNFESIHTKTKNERGEKPLETESLFFIESSSLRFRETTKREKPMRYNRLSFKKQKVRLYDDRDFENVPIFQTEKILKAPESEHDKVKIPKDLKSAELRRKAFLRKVSLQDTYVNYNQDYWLDYKKSSRFKSIDLGYFCKEDTDREKSGSSEAIPRGENSHWLNSTCHPSNKITQMKQTGTAPKHSYLPFMFEGSWGVKKSGSDSMIFSSKKLSCENRGLVDMEINSNELLTVVMNKCKNENFQKKKSWFFLPSNENIPLFSDRNGLIETDFDIFNEESLLMEKSPENYNRLGLFSNDAEQKESTFSIPMDFSSFCEIKLNEGEGEATKIEQKFS